MLHSHQDARIRQSKDVSLPNNRRLLRCKCQNAVQLSGSHLPIHIHEEPRQISRLQGPGLLTTPTQEDRWRPGPAHAAPLLASLASPTCTLQSRRTDIGAPCQCSLHSERSCNLIGAEYIKMLPTSSHLGDSP